MTNESDLANNKELERVARVLSTLAVERIFLKANDLKKFLEEEFSLSDELKDNLISEFSEESQESKSKGESK